MTEAAREEAAGGQAALAAECVTDPATLRRVRQRLRHRAAGDWL